jgi:general transcription factor 3C polypeptide 1
MYAFYIRAFECLTGYNIYFCLQDSQESELVASYAPRQDVQNHGGILQKIFVRKSRHRLHQKFVKLLNEGVNASRRVYESLAVSNAVELFKLVFLSTSAAPAVPNLLAEILRRYSQHDLFAAFSYLRENKIMVSSVFLVL